MRHEAFVGIKDLFVKHPNVMHNEIGVWLPKVNWKCKLVLLIVNQTFLFLEVLNHSENKVILPYHFSLVVVVSNIDEFLFWTTWLTSISVSEKRLAKVFRVTNFTFENKIRLTLLQIIQCCLSDKFYWCQAFWVWKTRSLISAVFMAILLVTLPQVIK